MMSYPYMRIHILMGKWITFLKSWNILKIIYNKNTAIFILIKFLQRGQ